MVRMDTDNEASGGLNLAERIRRLANGRSTLDVAQFQFIGMSEIRERYGARWGEKRERVGQIARQFITRRIAADDVLISGADGRNRRRSCAIIAGIGNMAAATGG